MKKATKFLISIVVFLMLIMPIVSFAAGLVPCDGTAASPCDFKAFMTLIDKVIKFMLFKMALPITAIMFAYAGFLLVTAGGEAAHARTKAKTIFTNAAVGFIIALAAFLIVRTILTILGYKGPGLDWLPI